MAKGGAHRAPRTAGLRFAGRSPLVRAALLTAGVLAVGLPAVLGVYAWWQQSVPVDAGSIATGAVELRTPTGTPTWTVGGQPFDPSHDTLGVGQSLQVSVPVRAVASGTTMNPTLSLNTADWPVTGIAASHVTVTTDLATVNPTLQAGTTPNDVRVTVTITPSASITTHGQLDLTSVLATLAAKPGSAWTDTYAYDLGTVDIDGTPQTHVTYYVTGTGTTRAAQVTLTGVTPGTLIDPQDGTGPVAATNGTNTITIAPGNAGGDHAQLVIYGTYTSIQFGSDVEAVTRWDANVGATSLDGAFASTTRLTGPVVSPPPTVTSMVGTFQNSSSNPPVGDWDVSAVTSMIDMFNGATLFDQPIGDWDVSAVTDMSRMFSSASAFDQPIGDWDVSAVTHMTGMFSGAMLFDQPVGDWDVSAVTDMSYMFNGATAFDQPVGDWDVSGVTNMSYTFNGATLFNQPIGNWDVSAVTNMSYTFGGAKSFNQPIGDWDVSSVTRMSGALSNTTAFNQPIGDWDVSAVTDTSWMFSGARAFNQPIGDWDVSAVTDMIGMFSGTTAFDQPIGDWDVSAVTRMSGVFTSAKAFNQPIGAWDVSAVTDMSGMFSSAAVFNQPIGSWDVSHVTDMRYMFNSAVAFAQDLSCWNVAHIASEPAFFRQGAPTIAAGFISPPWGANVGCPAPQTHVTYYVTGTGAARAATFSLLGATGTTWIDPGDGTGPVPATNGTNTVTIAPGNIGGDHAQLVIYGTYTSIQFGSDVEAVTRWDANVGVTNLDYAFAYSSRLTGPVVSPPPTVTSMIGTFENSSSNPPIADWDVSHVRSMVVMFYGAAAFNQPIGNWDVSAVTTMAGMFSDATAFNQPIGSWDVSHVISMASMFFDAKAFNQPIGDWNVSAATTMNTMFFSAAAFNQPIGSWDVSHVTSMTQMFAYATVFAQDLSCWNVTQIASEPPGFRAGAPSIAAGFISPPWGKNLGCATTPQTHLTYYVTSTGGNRAALVTLTGVTTGSVWINRMDGTAPVQATNSLNTITIATGNLGGDHARLVIYGSYDSIKFGPNIEAVTRWDDGVGATNLTQTFLNAVRLTTGPVVQPPRTVTKMSWMFSGATSFNAPIGDWDVSHVTAMDSMFQGATAFNQPIGGWDLSQVTTTQQMFYSATAFNQPIGGWNVTNVTRANMQAMFFSASAFKQDLRCWNVAHIATEPANFRLSAPTVAAGFLSPVWGTNPACAGSFSASLPSAQGTASHSADDGTQAAPTSSPTGTTNALTTDGGFTTDDGLDGGQSTATPTPTPTPTPSASATSASSAMSVLPALRPVRSWQPVGLLAVRQEAR